MKTVKQYKFIKNVIEKYGLEPAVRRDVSFFSWSCLAIGYTKLLRSQMGFSYEAVAVMGDKNISHIMFNAKYIADLTEKFIAKNFENLDKVFFRPAKASFTGARKQIKEIKDSNDPHKNLLSIANFYPDYFKLLAMYNCFFRYLGNEGSKGKLSVKLIKSIAHNRELVAKIYLVIEKLIKKYVKLIDKKEKFDKDLLRYFTRDEMINHLKGKKINRKILKELYERREKYFYLFIKKSNKEYIFTDKNLIDNIYHDFFKVKNETIKQINGYVAYKGIAKGIVYNPDSKTRSPNNFILVTSMTYPGEIKLIKQCRAIVTDEGGILSHAAIISREFKKPCIIGTKIATQILKDGDLVEVDANKGIVKILKKHE